MSTRKLALTLLSNDLKRSVVNTNLATIDRLVQLSVIAIGTNNPPADPEPGDAYIAGTSTTGSWVGHNGQVATWDGTEWQFDAPQPGWLVAVLDPAQCDLYCLTSNATWVLVATEGPEGPPGPTGDVTPAAVAARDRAEAAADRAEAAVHLIDQVANMYVTATDDANWQGANDYDSVMWQIGPDQSAISGYTFERAVGEFRDPVGALIHRTIAKKFPDSYIRNQANRATREVARRRAALANPRYISGLMASTSLCTVDGQSNSNGTQCFPPLLLSPTWQNRTTGIYMIGDSIHPRSVKGPDWVQCGDDVAFKRMIATVRGSADNTILTQAEYAALAPTDTNVGQTIMEGALLVFDWLRLRHFGLSIDPLHSFVAIEGSRTGKTAAQLAKDYVPPTPDDDIYPRLLNGAALAKFIDPNIKHLLHVMQQGESDTADGFGGYTDPTTWQNLTKQRRVDRHNDITLGLLNQTGEPMVPWFMNQIGGRGLINPGGLPIATAQLDLALNEPGFFISACHMGSRKGIHWDVNSTMWASQLLGYEIFELLVLNQNPIPFAPYEIKVCGNQMLTSFLTPEPPLQFATAYDLVGATVEMQTTQGFLNLNKGFYPWDSDGDLTITAIEVVEENSILKTCNRSFGSTPMLDYGRRIAPFGTGNVIDSSKFQFFKQIYDPALGSGVWESTVAYLNDYFPAGRQLNLFRKPATHVSDPL